MKLVFGSYNAHKLAEISAMLPDVEVLGLSSFQGILEVTETGSTLVENALLKAKSYAIQTGFPCFADDTGLEISALDGEPGVYSARYSAEATSEANTQKVLTEMLHKTNRTALFKTVIAFYHPSKQTEFWVEGILTGTIAEKSAGKFGFGYDPIFIPTNIQQTLAELNPEQKNQISHRKKAINLFISQLSNCHVL